MAMKQNSVVAVIVTCNRLEKFKSAYNSILNQAIEHLIVVENCSTDGTRQWLADNKNSKTTVLNMEKNIGGAGGFHAGFKYAVEHIDAEWILCFDDDAYADSELIEKFSRHAFPEDVGGVASAVFLPNGSIAEMNRPGRNPFQSPGLLVKILFNGSKGFHLPDEVFQMPSYEIDFASFVGLFVRMEAIRTGVGLPRKELFLYADDLFFALAIRQQGHKILFRPELKFIHDTYTLVEQKKVYTPVWKAYYTYRNALLVYKKVSGLLFPFVLAVKMANWLICTRKYKNKKVYLHLMLIAIKDSLSKDFSRPHEEILALSKGF